MTAEYSDKLHKHRFRHLSYGLSVPALAYLLIVALLLLPFLSSAQVHQYRFSHLSLENGLSSFRALDVVQDGMGYIWISTIDGLNRYDGNTIKVFRHNEENSKSLAWNLIRALYSDMQGNLWIGSYTEGGIDRFEPSTETFIHYRHNPRRPSSMSVNSITSIVEGWDNETNSHLLWIGTRGGGLLKFYPLTDSTVHLRCSRGVANTVSNDTITALAIDSTHTLWIGTASGLDAYDTRSGTFTHFKRSLKNKNSLSSNYISALLLEENHVLWIGTEHQLDRLDVKTGVFTHIQNSTGGGSITDNFVTKLIRQDDRFLWVGTGDGLNRLDKEKRTWTVFRQKLFDPTSLLNNLVWSLCRDRSGNIWVATDRGVSRFNPRSEEFHHYTLDDDPQSDQTVTTILVNSDNDLWLGTNDKGIKRFNPARGVFLADKVLDETREITVLYKDPRGGIWAASDVEPPFLARFNASAHRFEKIPCQFWIRTLLMDKTGTIWIGTHADGLQFFDPSRMMFLKSSELPSSMPVTKNPVHAIIQARDGTVWVGTEGDGLFSWDHKTKSVKHYTSDPTKTNTIKSNRIYALYEDLLGYLWIATGGGLNRFDPVTKTFKVYGAKTDGKSSYFIRILEDNRGRLWLSSIQNGLFCFDPKTGVSKSYSPREGVQSDIFYYATAKCNNGDLVFGGERGFNLFSPDSIYDNPVYPSIALPELRVLSDPPKLFFNATSIRSLSLEHDENYFSIEFAGLEFTNPDKNMFQYRLEPIDTVWRDARNQRTVTYAKIPDNEEYTFRVKASNSDGIWNEQGVSLPISIGPPFYKEWWFRILVAVVIIGAMTLGYNYRVSQLLAMERLRLRIAGDLHDDIGSSLSGIALMTDIVRNHISKESKDYQFLTTANFAARQTTDALRDIVWIINPEHDKPEDIILRMKSAASILLANMSYSFNHPSNGLPALDMEFRRNLILVYKEILNNIAKHSKAKNVNINVETNGKTFVLSIEDDGVGFDTEEAAKKDGHGLSSLQRRAEKLNGVVTIESTPGHGTTTTLKANTTRTRVNLFQRLRSFSTMGKSNS